MKGKISMIVMGVLLLSLPRFIFAQPAQLKVSGNRIVTASGGCTVQLKGVNIDSLEYNSVGDGPSNDILTALQEAVTGWGANIIRLPMSQDRWFGVANSNNKTAAYYQSLVQGLVQYCSQNNVYIILDLHWSGTYGGTAPTAPVANTNGWGTATAQQVMPDWNSVTFWSSVAAAYANNPAVIFDLYNEPHPDASLSFPNDWGIWLSGGSTSNTPSQTPGMQYLLNTVRGVGANNLVIAGGLQFCQDLTDINVYDLTDTASGFGVVYGAHIYGNTTGDTPTEWNNNIAGYTNKHPVFVGEFGNSTNCNVTDTTFNSNIFPWLNGTNSNSYVFPGATAWAFHPTSCPNMLTAWTSPPTALSPTEWGTTVENWLATPVPTCPSGPANTPTSTNTVTLTPTPTPTKTYTTTYTPTSTFTVTNSPTITNTFTPTNTSIPANTATDTATSTLSSTPTDTFTTGPANTSTQTPVVSYTFTDTPTTTDTPTWTNTTGVFTSTNTPTLAVPTNTDTPGGLTGTFTNTPVFSSTFTTIFSPTNTSTPVNPTDTFTVTIPTNTFTVVPPTNTVTATFTNTAVNTATYTFTFTPTFTPTPAFISHPYPNPVTGSGPVNINVTILGTIKWDVFTAAFRKVNGGMVPSGTSSIQWNLKDSSNFPVANGLYYLRVQVGAYKVVQKVIVIR